MDWEEILDPLSPMYKDAMQEQIKMVNLQDGLIEAAKKLAAENYPALKTATPGIHKALNSVIIRHSIKMSVDINDAIAGGEAEDFQF
ncbi:hypothetical protein [Chitinophaga sp.]|uniref:hypothetical protein n=1 Tax=Chitinophaga sp. TaxID=1869181 RepID=UPI002F95C804